MVALSGSRPDQRTVTLRLIQDADHYHEIVVRGLLEAKTSIWISTANLKDLHVEAPIGTRARARGRYESLFERLSEFARAGIEVRILHAGAPSRALSARLARVGGKKQLASTRRCPRVHLKLIAVDGSFLYLGSANFTGAGLGAKGEGRRNFETGIATTDDLMLDQMQETFDRIWSGRACAGCKLRGECPAPLDELAKKRERSV